MRKIRVLALSLVLGAGMTPAAFLAAPVHAAHADQYDCSSSWLPCDGTNLDYNNSLGDTPMPYDENWSVWDQSYDTGYLGDAPLPFDENWDGWSQPYDTGYPLGDPCGYADAGC